MSRVGSASGRNDSAASREPELKPGKALDLLTEKVEKWATSYRRLDEPERWESDFEARFRREAAELARRSTAEARRFEARDWFLAVILWALIAVMVWLFSVFVMQLDGVWPLVFAAFAVLVGAVGVWQSYLEVTSEKRAAGKLAKNEQWLLGVTRKTANRLLSQRAAARGTGS
ncbi:hypothetical protein GCM10011490_29340 [Pseudoclavibacter endophyticus]|uniref:Uncharacterized protein n=1 Tax=Pseudoclavibacter endophyticus TaxID=1778590 RepID=A0A6H9WLQ7_9MICO|nr:hypothetical protein [Pseudoclavibacter endophyticus]KAB1646660.1 hypothetical protein F8O04_12965 [Pseudoclavibacter endophyticus]GGA76704.1 hypothetical protein GCM10011490_29340 [Pseudoclavibacter endophyticus]